jgi:membrane-bound serine protease (ClpP class)
MKQIFRKGTLLFILLFFCVLGASAQKRGKVLIIPISEEINNLSSHYVELGLKEAEKQNVDAILLDINTFGGALLDADKIVNKILKYPKPVWAFVNKNAISGGAFITISCDSIYMTKGAVFGAATVVTGDGKYAPEKYQSAMRSLMRSTAEANKRDIRVAEAMVDESFGLDTLLPAGKLLTLDSKEAIRYHYCEAEVKTIDDILRRNNASNYEKINFKIPFLERLIAFFMNPAVSSILILLIIGGIYFELQSPGIGFALAVSIVAMALYFVPYYLHGLAQNWELYMFLGGIGLLAIEILFIPGFKLPGMIGLLMIFASLGLMMIGNDGLDFSLIPNSKIYTSLAVSTLGLFSAFVVIAILAPRLAQSKSFSHVALQTSMDSKKGFTTSHHTNLIGHTGTAYTVLRPSGKIKIQDALYDACTQGDFIEKDAHIIVIGQQSNELIVKEENEKKEG